MIALFSILIIYCLLLAYFAFGFLKTKTFYDFQNNEYKPVSIIICARNEEKHISRCLSTILSQDYPKNLIEIIFIDDASNDSTLQLAQNILKNSEVHFQLIKNKAQKGKKLSLTEAIEKAKSELIITRDADTFTKSDLWLSSIVAFQKQTQADFIIAPIALNDNEGLFWALQAIENNILAVLAGGSNYYQKSFLCNGANLAFTKTIFNKCNGYQSHLKIASGDDVLFLEDVKKIQNVKIKYLKTERAIVYTYPNHNLKSLLSQKIRWAGKFKYNKNKLNLFLAALSFAANLAWLICFVYGFIATNNNEVMVFFILFKIFIDFLILMVASSFIKNTNLIWYSLPVGFVYPIYTFIVAIASIILKPKWKE